tara:strand:- start:2808 stop:3494 length:687 start_codon:yes stop_codon:yes gene_type:complete
VKSKLILGDGLLGSELVKQTGWDYISRKKDNIDFTNFYSYRDLIKDYDVIINCIAYTDTYDTDRDKHWLINYESVSTLVTLCNILNKKLVHISTDYLYSNSKSNASEEDVPVHCRNWYGYTKLLADGYIQLKSNDYLLLRGTHKKEPFTYNEAWTNQVGNFDYVSEISKLYIKLIESDVNGIYNVGTDKKTMYDLAKKTNINVKPVDRLVDESTPMNLTMDMSKLKEI